MACAASGGISEVITPASMANEGSSAMACGIGKVQVIFIMDIQLAMLEQNLRMCR
jgi:hypothetical protein